MKIFVKVTVWQMLFEIILVIAVMSGACIAAFSFLTRVACPPR